MSQGWTYSWTHTGLTGNPGTWEALNNKNYTRTHTNTERDTHSEKIPKVKNHQTLIINPVKRHTISTKRPTRKAFYVLSVCCSAGPGNKAFPESTRFPLNPSIGYLTTTASGMPLEEVCAPEHSCFVVHDVGLECSIGLKLYRNNII